MKKFIGLIAPALALELTLAACGGSAAPASSAPAPASAAAKPSTAASASAKPAAESASAKPAASASAAASAIATIPSGTKVKIVTATGVTSVVFSSVWIAMDNGLFAKYGLDATLQPNLEGTKQSQAMIAGDVQVGNVGGAEVLNGRAAGTDLEAIMETTASPLFELHAPPAVKSVEELKGKLIAVTASGSSTDIAGRLLVSKHGLDPNKDVKFVNTSNMQGILAAMVANQVQAGVVSPPTTSKATASGFPKLAGAIDEHVPLQNNLVVVSKKYADAHPEVVFAYLQALLEANKVFQSQPDVAVKAIAKYTDSSQADSQAAYDTMKEAMDQVGLVREDGLKSVQQYGGNPKAADVKLSDAYDNSFLNRLKASGFIDGLGLKPLA